MLENKTKPKPRKINRLYIQLWEMYTFRIFFVGSLSEMWLWNTIYSVIGLYDQQYLEYQQWTRIRMSDFMMITRWGG